MQALGDQELRCVERAGGRQKLHIVAGHRLRQRSAQRFPVGKQLGQGPGVHDGAAQDMGARLGALFQHHHRNIRAFFSRLLLQPDGGRQPARAATHHDNVVFHGFTGAVLGQNFLLVHRGVSLMIFAKIDSLFAPSYYRF